MRRALYWLPALAYMGLIWGVSSLSFAFPVEDFPLRDKGVHLVEFSGLGFLLADAAIRSWPRRHVLRTAALAILITVLFGLLDEIHQAFIPGRGSEALDLVADAVGGIIGAGARSLFIALPFRRSAESRP